MFVLARASGIVAITVVGIVCSDSCGGNLE